MRFTVVRSKVIDILNKDYYYYYYKAVHVRFVTNISLHYS